MAMDKEKRAKFWFYLLMIITAPIWALLCIIYGLIIGPIGFQFFLFQYHRDAYLRNLPKYNKYLEEVKTGTYKPIEDKFNPVYGTWTYEPPPPSPLKMIFILLFFNIGMIPLSIIWGIIVGPISAMELFWRRIYFKFFPKEILKEAEERKQDV